MSARLFCAIFLIGVANASKSSGPHKKGSFASYIQSSTVSYSSSSSSSSDASSSSSTSCADSNKEKCDLNSTYKKCPIPCPPTCENPDGSPNCKKLCEPYGCECDDGYVKSEAGKCVLLEDCPGKCDRNSTYKKCPKPCPPTCDNPDGSPNCKKLCEPYGCECDDGYVQSENGKCVLLDDCPDYLRCNGDYNATFNECPSPCPATCAFPGNGPCITVCAEEGCQCKPGFYLNDEKRCVRFEDCPGAKTCSVNETFVFCNVGCPTSSCPKNDNRGIVACSQPFPCGSGCSCKPDYLRLPDDGRCILSSDCPPINCTRPNEVFSARPPPCLYDRCSDIGQPNPCDRPFPNKPQCVCKPGFFRDRNDICIPKEQCQQQPTCGLNEVLVECKTQCPPQSCKISYTEYFCFDTPCEPGCDCLPGFLRNDTGDCIPSDQCPPPPSIPECKENEELTRCKIPCPPQTCESLYTLYSCPKHSACEWGCDCKDGFLRNGTGGACIPSDQCPSSSNPLEPVCGSNEFYSDCKIQCPPQTCESIYSSYLCSNETVCEPGCDCLGGFLRNSSSGVCIPSEKCFSECEIPRECRPTCANPNPGCQLVNNGLGNTNKDGCSCEIGFILSDPDGVCIKVEECPDEGCNGDLNSVVTSCPWPYPSTCDSPKAGSYEQKCDPVGCQCKSGFILSSDEGGKCILPEKCACGNPCGPNGTFSECAFDCPNQYCPQDDSGLKVACKPGRPCPSGCLCNPGYLKKSFDDQTCVLASDCPPVNCTRPNEVWDSCPSECLSENCEAVDSQPTVCNTLIYSCNPRCVCKEGYFRDDEDTCVSSDECRWLNKKARQGV